MPRAWNVACNSSRMRRIALFALIACAACDRSPKRGSVEVTRGELTGAPIAEVKERDPLKVADRDMKAVLVQLDALGVRPIATLGVEEARAQPTPAAAVKALVEKDGVSAAPLAMAKVENHGFEGPGGRLDVRIYTPKSKETQLPVVLYFHGGGFVLANLDTYDASARALADAAKALVVSADYRHAPEHKFPAAHDDAFAAYVWTLEKINAFGGDPNRVAVAGEGAGGNLAVNVSMRARDERIVLPKHQLLVYPLATTATATDSYKEWAHAKPLDKDAMAWFMKHASRTPADAEDPRLDLLRANLAGLPATSIVLAEIDPLRDDGVLLGKRLDAQGVKVEQKTYAGVTHEFFGMGAKVGDAKDAVKWAGKRLEKALEKSAIEKKNAAASK